MAKIYQCCNMPAWFFLETDKYQIKEINEELVSCYCACDIEAPKKTIKKLLKRGVVGYFESDYAFKSEKKIRKYSYDFEKISRKIIKDGMTKEGKKLTKEFLAKYNSGRPE